MKVTATALAGVMIIEPAVFEDARGSFCETYADARFDEFVTGPLGMAPVRFVQDNESHSRRGVVRGLHFQREPHAQAKLVRVAAGRVLDAAVDMRLGSPTFGRHVAVDLSAANRRQLFIPRGFAHGFIALEEDSIVIYKVDAPYAPQSDGGVRWDDPALGIDWGFDPAGVIISDKDAALPALAGAYKFERL